MSDNVHILSLSAYNTPTIQESKRENWVEFGDDNNYFQFLIDRYTKSTTNNAIINNISRLVYGQGLNALDASRKPSEYAQMKTLFSNDDIRKMAFDKKLFGQFAIQVHYNEKHDAILKAFHIPINLLRAEKCNAEGDITGYYYSDDWSDIKKFAPQRFNAFGFSKEKIEILFVKPYGVGMKYYSHPDYQGAIPYTILEESVADYLINEVQNGFSPGMKIINFCNGVPTEEQQSMITNKVMNKLTGSQGQKVIVAFNDNAESKTTVEDIPLNDAPAHYEYLSQECLSKIMLGHNVTSPLIFGIATTTGFSSNADELRNSIVLFDNMVIKPLQQEIIEAINKILSFNGIALNLEFKGLNPLDATGDITNTSDNVKLLDSINNVSPLVANKILESMTANEIRQIVGLAPEQGGSDLPTTSVAQALSSQGINELIDLGEDPLEEWLLIDEFEVDYDEEDAIDLEIEKANNPKKSLLSKIYDFASIVSTGTARPRAKDQEQDKTIDDIRFITRYRYSGGTSENTRDFCKAMVSANKVYRKEDIIQMGRTKVNPGWGANGADTYSIWLYKGGGACHHKWMRQTFVSFDKGMGIDPLSPNAKTISTNKAEKAGYRIRNPQQVSMRPIDMPNEGFLPTNKRFN